MVHHIAHAVSRIWTQNGHRRNVLPVLIAVGWLLMAFSPVATAQDDISPALRDQLDQLKTYAEQARQLEPLETLVILFPARADVAAMIADELANYNADEVAEDLLFYTAFDLLPPDTDIIGLLRDLYTGQIGGFYDTERNEMNVLRISGAALGDGLPLIERITFVHEYVHALQDQHFDLDGLLAGGDDANETGHDVSFARLALVEGDATFILNVYTQQEVQRNPLGALLQVTLGGLSAGNLTLPAGTPAIIGEELLWPYLGGERFVRALYADGGWQAVNAAYDNPPQSTEHILYPDTYLAGDMPQRVTLGDANLPDDWQLGTDGTMGAFYLEQVLAAHIANGQAETAVQGWGGDAYRIYRNETGDIAWQMHLVWDTPQDASEFDAAFADYAQARTEAETVFNYDIGGACWEGATLTLCSATSTDGLTRISAGPDVAIAELLVRNQVSE